MNRRQILLGVGSLTLSGTLVAETGAFTSVSASRSVSVAVANDTDALLALSPCDGPNGDYVRGASSGVMELDLSSTNQQVPGDGVNANAQTVIDDVFEIKNQGTQTVGVWLNVNPVVQDDSERVEFRVTEGDSGAIVGQGNAVCLGVGESVCVGLVIDTHGIDPDDYGNLLQTVPGTDHEMVVNADADVGCQVEEPPILEPLSLSTGVSDWMVTGLPSTASPPDGKSLSYAAYEIENPPSAWIPAAADAAWVDPFGTGGLESDPADSDDPYVYELEFEVGGPSTLVIEGYAADNPVQLFLDGQPIGGTTDDEAYDQVRTDVPPQQLGVEGEPGTHTLRAEVINEPNSSDNPTGLMVAAKLLPSVAE